MGFFENFSNRIINLDYHAFLNCPSSTALSSMFFFASLPKLLFNYIVFEFTLLLVVWPRYFENYIATISYIWDWASKDPRGQWQLRRHYLPISFSAAEARSWKTAPIWLPPHQLQWRQGISQGHSDIDGDSRDIPEAIDPLVRLLGGGLPLIIQCDH